MKARVPPPPGRPDRRGRRLRLVGLTALLAGAAVVLALVVGSHAGGSAVSTSNLPGTLTSRAPWPANTVALEQRLQLLGLPALLVSGTALHIHSHLDLSVDGRRVTVPAGVGIDEHEGFLSPLHTHDTSGVIHVESPDVRTFTLGQFFGVWGVRLTPDCLGGYCASGGKRLRAFVDGRPVGGDPRSVPLGEHEEIVVAYGTRAELPRPVPSGYDFPAGL